MGDVRMVRALTCLIAVASTLAACERGGESLDTPFPAQVTKVRFHHPECRTHCFVGYQLGVTNPTDRDVNVLECHLVPAVGGPIASPVLLTIGEPAGVWVPAGATRLGEGSTELRLAAQGVATLRHGTVTCTGVDWHGNLPI